jgi:8-oxo-dGTP pyrophosphatase MutT (NUDIX family)
LSNRSRKAQVWIGFQAKGSAPEVLLFRVIDRRGGGWHPVTGGVDDHEKFADGAKRELEEETGMNVHSGEWIDLDYEVHFDGRWGPVEERAYALILREAKIDPVLDPKEHLEFQWVPLKEARARLEFDSQRNALDQFSCYFK